MSSILQEEREYQDELDSLDLDSHRDRVRDDVDEFLSKSPSRSRTSKSGSPYRQYGTPSPSKSGSPGSPYGNGRYGSEEPAGYQAGAQAGYSGSGSGGRYGSGSPRVSTAEARGKAERLYKAMKGFGTKEAAIYKELESVSSQEEWQEVQRQFKQRYPSFHKGDLVAALEDELTKSEMDKAKDTLAAKGVQMQEQSMAERLNGFTDRLYKAMKGMGTDEDEIYRVVGEINNNPEWSWVKRDFQKDYPKFHNGDAVAALKDELTDKELQKVREILASKGIQLDGSSSSYSPGSQGRYGSGSPGSQQQGSTPNRQGGQGSPQDRYGSTPNRQGSQGQGQGQSQSQGQGQGSSPQGDRYGSTGGSPSPTRPQSSTQQQSSYSSQKTESYSSTASKGKAERLYKAMKGFGTKEATIYKELESINSTAEWKDVQAQFKQQYPSFHKGDLVAALQDELTKTEMDKAKGILAAKGIQLEEQGLFERLNGFTERLYKAMKGMGTNEGEIYRVVEEVNSPAEWDWVKRDFQKDYPKFHNGDVEVALQDELNDKEHAKVCEILASRGIRLDGRTGKEKAADNQPQDSRSKAERLYKAMKGFGTKEAAIYKELESINSTAEWKDVQAQFKQQYPSFHKGDLVAALQDELTKTEMDKAKDILAAKGIQMQEQGLFERLNGFTERLYKAMKGMGTNEGEIYRVVEEVNSPAEWDWVKRDFQKDYPKFHNGDVEVALQDELNDKEHAKVCEILASRGIRLDGRTGKEKAADNQPQDSRSKAERLYKAMKGFGTKEAAIYKELESINSTAEWKDVQAQFKQQYPSFHKGDLVTALQDELNKTEMNKAKDILAAKGIQLEEQGLFERLNGFTERLYKAMKGMGTNEGEIYRVVEEVNSPAEWDWVKRDFQKDYPKFHNGDVEVALQDELNDKEHAKVCEILASRGIRLDGRTGKQKAVDNQPQDSRSKAERLYKAMKGFGTKETAIYKELESINSTAEWKDVQAQFEQQYPSFQNGDLVAALQDELTKTEMDKAKDILAAKGIQMQEQGLFERLNGFTERLYKAMKGMGTNEGEIYRVVEEVNSPAEWDWVKRDFQKDYPKFHNGNVVAALQDELSKKELDKVSEILAARGVQLIETGFFARLDGFAEKLYKAMKGFGTNEDAIFSVLEGINTTGEWEYVKREFAEKYPKFHNGDAVAAMKDELNKKEEQKCRDIFAAKGIPLF